MANQRISELTEKTTIDPGDFIPIVNNEASPIETQYVTYETLSGIKTTTTTSSTTPTPTGDARRNELIVTALADNATVGAPTGTANTDGMIRLRITATGATRTVGYNAALEAGNITRTTSLPAGSTLTQIYSRIDGAWICQFDDVTT